MIIETNFIKFHSFKCGHPVERARCEYYESDRIIFYDPTARLSVILVVIIECSEKKVKDIDAFIEVLVILAFGENVFHINLDVTCGAYWNIIFLGH